MSGEEGSSQLVRGRVKWFDPSKGYGFIVSEQTGVDILLHANVLKSFGRGSVADGSGIEVLVQRTLRGAQAVEVVRIDPPEGVTLLLHDDAARMDDTDIKELPLEPARVKWFEKSKGFGFATVFGRPEDVFLHAEVLRISGLSILAAGEAIALRIIDGPRGRMAVHVEPWEAAIRESS